MCKFNRTESFTTGRRTRTALTNCCKLSVNKNGSNRYSMALIFSKDDAMRMFGDNKVKIDVSGHYMFFKCHEKGFKLHYSGNTATIKIALHDAEQIRAYMSVAKTYPINRANGGPQDYLIVLSDNK